MRSFIDGKKFLFFILCSAGTALHAEPGGHANPVASPSFEYPGGRVNAAEEQMPNIRRKLNGG